MKKINKFLTFGILLISSISWAQCISPTAFGSATVSSCAPSINITTCAYGGEYSTVTFSVTGPYQFTGTGGAGNYLTLTDGLNVVKASGFSPLNYTITTLGVYRLHVSINALCGTESACHTLAYSCLNACNPVTALSTTTVGATSGTFTWTAPAGNYDVYYGPAPLVAPTGTTVPTATTTANSFTATSLLSSTAYAAYVRVNCGATQSTWVLTTFTTPCSGTPSAGTTAINTSTALCASQNVNFSLTGASVGGGLTYLWQSSTNGITYTTIPTSTLATTTQSVTGNVYYQCVLACGASTAASVPVNVIIASTTTNTVPYFEGFEGIVLNNQLPNCSWVKSNPTICLTYTVAPGSYNRIAKSGTKFGSFRWGTNTAGDYFYSNGIQLTAGVTYSASSFYISDGAAGWSQYSMLYGTTQSTVGLLSIASMTGAITNTVYAQLSNTFTPATTGIYYVAIKAIGTSVPWYLTFDDLSITAPCSLNVPTMTVSASTTTICAGQSVDLTASGTVTSYTWNTGATTMSISPTPTTSLTYTTIGTSPIGCTVSVISPSITVNTTSVSVNSGAICAGSSFTISPAGTATSYSISGGSAVVTPTASSSYTVTGTNSVTTCSNTAISSVTVNANPTVSASTSNSLICTGASVVLTASTSATSYTWNTGATTMTTSVTPTVTTTYTVNVSNAASCNASAVVIVNVNTCTGINEASANSISVYPNPTNGVVNINLTAELAKNASLEVYDALGKLVVKQILSNELNTINISNLENGIYVFKVLNNTNTVKIGKLIKQ